MGNYFTKNVEENFRKNQDFNTEISKIKIERQLHMRNELREREVALELATQRELFYWLGAFYLTSLVGTIISYKKYKRTPLIFAPMLPLTFLLGYQADFAYGTKLHRIKVEAEHILQFEGELLDLPLGVPTASSIDLKRMESDENKKLHPHIPHV